MPLNISTNEEIPIISINKSNKQEKYYKSISEACRRLNINFGSIQYHINCKRQPYMKSRSGNLIKNYNPRGLKSSDGNTYIFRKATKEEIEKYGNRSI